MVDAPTATMREPGDPEDVPDTPEARAELLRDYLWLLAENPEAHLGILGEDTDRHRQWVDRAAFAAEIIESGILWDASESDIGLAAAGWRDMREAVENADD